MLRKLEAALADCAARQITVTYAQMAALIGLEGPGRIGKLTDALETLMEQDAQIRQPLRAALVVGRSAGGLPARGFFLKANELGLGIGQAPQAFHASQVSGVFAMAANPAPDT
ncbi:hypothetical protein [Roseinatronobacter sp.]